MSSPATDERFARNLKTLRTAKGITQEELAKEMARRGFRWHQATVYKVESGERQVPIGEAVALTEILGLSLDRILGADSSDAAHRAHLDAAHWALIDARDDLVNAVYRYGQARQAFAAALDELGRGSIPIRDFADMRHDAQLGAIRDWPELKARDDKSVRRNPPHEQSVFDAET